MVRWKRCVVYALAPFVLVLIFGQFTTDTHPERLEGRGRVSLPKYQLSELRFGELVPTMTKSQVLETLGAPEDSIQTGHPDITSLDYPEVLLLFEKERIIQILYDKTLFIQGKPLPTGLNFNELSARLNVSRVLFPEPTTPRRSRRSRSLKFPVTVGTILFTHNGEEIVGYGYERD